jgi:L-alanine-DL-glutamate epimerase-like enolase superfamily enzyme
LGEIALPDPFVPPAHASEAMIAGVEITRRRLRFDPAFYATWDTKPRTFWDAAIVAVHTDLGVTGYGSGDMMLDSSGMIVLSDRPGMGYERNIDALASTRVT